MDGLRELVEAFSARIKSPIIGSIVLAFVAVNWRAVFFLFFSGEPASDKFVYFTENTTGYSLYVFPVLVGLAFALIVPWINFWGAKAIETPVSKHRSMQLDAAHALAEKKARYAVDMETLTTEYRSALLDRAKVDQEIKEANIDEDVRTDLENKLVEAKASTVTDIVEIEAPLSNISKHFLKRAAANSSGRIKLSDRSGQYYVTFGIENAKSDDAVDRKSFLEIKEAVGELIEVGYMESSEKDAIDLTTAGYAYLKKLATKEPEEK